MLFYSIGAMACSCCGKEKPFKKGLQCAECFAKKKRAYYLANIDSYRRSAREWAARNGRRHAKHMVDWYNENPERYLLRNARVRARKLGRKFSIGPEDVVIPKFCPALGIPLVTGTLGKGKRYARQDGAPSIDRIDSSKGYVKGNVVVVSWRANRLKNDATPEDMKKLVAFYCK